MIASTLQIFAIAVLASSIIDDLGVSRAALGLIGAVNTGLGALTAPLSGRLTDRIGARNSVFAVLVLATAGMALMAMSHSAWLLVASGVVMGVPQGWSNPATNALIAATLPEGERGTVMGVKQSGVTVAVVLAGFTMPWLEGLRDWRFAAGVFAVLFGATAVAAAVLLPRNAAAAATAAPVVVAPGADVPAGDLRAGSPGTPGRPATPGRLGTKVTPFVKLLAVYALLMGLAAGAIGRWLPLFAEEAIGWSQESGGALVAVAGAVGVAARVVAARRAEHGDPVVMLRTLALIGLAASLLVASASTVGGWVLWPMAVLYGVGYTAWNAVINLTIVMRTPLAEAGRSSGVMMLGFLGGLTLSAPLGGAVVDSFGSYAPVWAATIVLAAASAALLARRPHLQQ